MKKADAAIMLGEAAVKIEKVINSCKNREQLEVARKMLQNWVNLGRNYGFLKLHDFQTLKKVLEDSIGEKALELHKGI